MQSFKFKPYPETNGVVTAYLHTPISEIRNPRTAYPSVIICAGGGYEFTSQCDKDPIAFGYLAAGYNTFILDYSCLEEAKNFNPLKELSATVMAIRANATEWACHPNQIAVVGFSAGGHLACSLATMWNHPEFTAGFDNQGEANRPDAIVLSYPVITADEHAHVKSIEFVSGETDKTSEKFQLFSLDKRVHKNMPPVFVWHTVADTYVPVENTIKLITALQKNKISYECHLFPTGGHALTSCTHETGTHNAHNRQWFDLSINWLNKTFNYKL